MSKEKIIGLSVIGVLSATLAGVTAWRMMGGRATSPEPAALAGDGKAEAAPGEDNSTGPTVLASATSSNDELAARLSGKTKIKGGWETAAPASSAPQDPMLPAGTQSSVNTDIAAYAPTGSELNPAFSDQERHPSYMPRENTENAAMGEARYSTEVAGDDPASIGALAENSASEALEVPNELTPDPTAQAALQTSDAAIIPGDAAGQYGSSEQEAVQIIEPEQIPEASLVQQIESDPEAERAAIRAADDARFAETYAKEQEKISISEAALPPLSGVSQEVSSEEGLSATDAASPPARFAADARFTASDRYSSAEESEQPAATAAQSVTPTEATAPEKTTAPHPAANYSNTAPPADAYRAQPSYRDSVYREPAAVSGAGSSPIAGSAKTPAASAAQTQAAPYVDHSQAASPYGATTRSASVSTGSLPHAVAEKHVPLRENTGKYYVEPGDSMWTISKKVYGNGGFFKALQEHNRARFISPANLQVGDEVLTPTIAELRDMYSGLCPKERIAKPGSPAATSAAHVPVSQSVDVRQYEVQAGDTLYDIARYELGDASRWPEIFQLNRLALGVDIDYVKPGTKLVLPMDAPIKSSPEGEGYRGDILTRKPGDIRK